MAQLTSSDTWPEDLETTARRSGWRTPLLLTLAAAIAVTLLAALRTSLDFEIYRAAGSHAWSASLYRFLLHPAHLGFTYPPFAALLYAPAALIPERVAQVMGSLLNLGALGVVIGVSLRACRPAWDRRTVLWWTLALIVPVGLLDPVRESLLLGQVNIILVAAVLYDALFVSPRRRGVLIGLAAAIKLTPLIFVPYFLLTGRRATAGRTATSFAVASGLAAIVSPAASWSYWTRYAWSPGRTGSIRWIGNQSLVGALDRILPHPMASLDSFAVGALVGVAGLWVAWRADRRVSPVLGVIVICATEALATPVSWTHHYVWVVLLVAWLALDSARPRHGLRWALAVAVFFWAAPFWWVPHGAGVVVAGHGLSLPVADSGCLFLVAALAMTAWMGRARPRPALGGTGQPGPTSSSVPELTS